MPSAAPPSLLGRLAGRFGYRPGKLAANTLTGTFWQIVRLGCQVLSIVVIGRVLGPGGYGTLAGFGGLAVMLGGMTGLGGGYLLLQAVSRDPGTFGRYWHATTRLILLSGVVLAGLYAALAGPLLRLHLDLLPLLAVALSELLCYPLVYACGYAFQAHEQLGWATGLPAGMALVRLLGAGLFLVSGVAPRFEHYALFHLGASLLAMVGAWVIVVRRLRPGAAAGHYTWAELRNGMGFSASWFTTNAYGELDKVLAVRYLGAGAAGSYAIAYRLTNALAMPIASLVLAAQPRMFRHAHDAGAAELRRLLAAIVLVSLGYALLAALAVVAVAPLLTLLLGTAFAPAIDAARMLAPLLPLFGLRLVAGILLASLGRPVLRALLETLAIVQLAGMSALLVPRYGLTGIVGTVLATEGTLLATLAFVTLRTMRDGRGSAT